MVFFKFSPSGHVASSFGQIKYKESALQSTAEEYKRIVALHGIATADSDRSSET